MGDADMLDPASGKFVTFCQLNKDSCVFLVHVPNLAGPSYSDEIGAKRKELGEERATPWPAPS